MSLRKRLIYLLSDSPLWFFHFFIAFRKLMSQRSIIVNEVIRTVYLFIYLFYKDILHKKTQALFKYLNTPKKHNKAHKQLSFRYYT